MDFIKEAISQNGHWEGGIVAITRVEKVVERTVFSQLEQATWSKFIVVIRGLRRTGKSVLARQLMQKIIGKKLEPTEVGWFEFDRSMGATYDDLNNLVKFFENRGVKLLVLDEVAFVKGWQDALKRHYDNSETKFIVTGSSALELDKRSSESLAGRFKTIKVEPFSFREYLLLKGKTAPVTELQLVKNTEEMEVQCGEYLRAGGLPEAITLSSEDRRSYVKDSLLEPLFYKDINVIFPSANPDMLLKILELLCTTVGSTFQFQTMAQVLGCSHPTVASQVEVLNKALLVSQLFNYSGSIVKQRRTAKKILVADNGVLTTLNPEVNSGYLAENLVGQSIKATHFWRDGEGREIDFIIHEKKLAIEVKYQAHITKEDEKNLNYFLERHGGWKGILITKNHESNGKIKHIPLWKWLLKQQTA